MSLAHCSRVMVRSGDSFLSRFQIAAYALPLRDGRVVFDAPPAEIEETRFRELYRLVEVDVPPR